LKTIGNFFKTSSVSAKAPKIAHQRSKRDERKITRKFCGVQEKKFQEIETI
jgi:hypothetical protein